MAAFGKQIVMMGVMSAKFGRSFNEAQKLPELADYLGDPLPKEAAATAVRLAGGFVAAVEQLVAPPDDATS